MVGNLSLHDSTVLRRLRNAGGYPSGTAVSAARVTFRMRKADSRVIALPLASVPKAHMTPAARQLLTVFPSIMLPMFLAVVDQTIVATALPAIAAELGNVEHVSWVDVAYLVATTIAAPVYGQL